MADDMSWLDDISGNRDDEERLLDLARQRQETLNQAIVKKGKQAERQHWLDTVLHCPTCENTNVQALHKGFCCLSCGHRFTHWRGIGKRV